MDEKGKDNIEFTMLTNEKISIENDEQEQAEAEEDQRRRQQELQSMLANAFDDFGDENSTLNSSFDDHQTHNFDGSASNVFQRHSFEGNIPQRNSLDGSSSNVLTSGNQRSFVGSSSNSGYQKSFDESLRQIPEANLDEQYREATYNSVEQLQVLYQAQAMEIKRLNKEFSSFQEEAQKEKNALKRQMMLLEAEKSGINMSLKQSQGLLVEKNRIIEENMIEVNNLKESVDKLKLSKTSCEEEIQIWKTRSMEFEQKLNLIDKGLYVPVSERQIRSKFENDISELQNSLEQTQKALEQTQKAKIGLENDIKDIKQARDLLVMEKEEELHNLFTQLENSKYHCLNLTEKVGFLEKEYQNLTTIVNNTNKEIDTTVQTYSGPIKTLQQELKRSLEDQKNKRDEILKLEQNLELQKNKERELLDHINQFEIKNKKLESENKDIQKDLEKMKKTFEKLGDDYQKLHLKTDGKGNLEEINILKEQNEELKLQLQNLNIEKMNLEELIKNNMKVDKMHIAQHVPNESGDAKMQNVLEMEFVLLQNQNSDLLKQLKDYEIDSENCKQQLKKYEELCLDLQGTCATQKTKYLEYQSKITELEGRLKLKEKRDELLEDLQQKARMFEDYIKTKSELIMIDKGINTDINVETEDVNLKDIEKEKINQLTGKIFEIEEVLKAKDVKILQILSENDALKNHLNIKTKNDNQEKETILKEFEAILKEKDEQIVKILTQNEALKNNVESKTKSGSNEKETLLKELAFKHMEFEKVLKEKDEKLSKIINENKTLKDKVIFDRMALSELTDVWNDEISRLNNVVTELKKEIETKNSNFEEKLESLNEDISRKTVLISKLTESMRHKDRFIKEYQEKEISLVKDYENIKKQLKSDYDMKEARFLAEFEQNEKQRKSEFHEKEEHLKSTLENVQKKFSNGLEDIQQKINSQMKYNNEKFTLETKIIEAYYDLLIQQANLRKPNL